MTPDLSSFGKGMANGYPLSAIVGRRDLMEVLESAFISGTFGGELLSLTAANVVLDRIATTNVIAEIAEIGAALRERVEAVVAETGATDLLSFSGHPSWTFTSWNSSIDDLAALKNLFMQEMCRSGVLMMATHNVTAAHDEAALQTIVEAYRHTLPIVVKAVADGSATSLLDAEVEALAPSVR